MGQGVEQLGGTRWWKALSQDFGPFSSRKRAWLGKERQEECETCACASNIEQDGGSDDDVEQQGDGGEVGRVRAERDFGVIYASMHEALPAFWCFGNQVVTADCGAAYFTLCQGVRVPARDGQFWYFDRANSP